MNISEETKNRIIELFCNTHKNISGILKEVAPNGEITIEDAYNVLNEYKTNNPDKLKRKEKVFHSSIDIADDELFELREQGLSYKEIVEYLNKNGITSTMKNVSERCKIIYSKKGKKEPHMRKPEISDEEIFELREQGLTYKEIAEYFSQKGIKVTSEKISARCKMIYSQIGKEKPDMRRIKIQDEEIFKLREQGYSYRKITDYFNEKGVKVSYNTILERCYNLRKSEKKKVNKVKSKNQKVEIPDSEIFELSEQGFTFKEIANYFKEKGIKVSANYVLKRCRELYSQIGKEKVNLRKVELPDDEVIELRERGFTYKEMVEYFKGKGIKVSCKTISERCNEIYNTIGKKEPRSHKETRFNDFIDNKIIELRSEGASYREIEKSLKECGIKVSFEAIRSRIKQINGENKKINSKCDVKDKDKIKKAIVNLKKSRNATDEQLRAMAELYGVEIELEDEKEL